MTLRDFTQEDSSTLSRDTLFAFVVGFLVIALLRVMVTYTQCKHPLDGSESHAHGLKGRSGPSPHPVSERDFSRSEAEIEQPIERS